MAGVSISVFGLGYVGAVSVACLAKDGHDVVGVDVNATKVGMIGAGRSPIVEPGLSELLARGVSEGRIRATTDAAAAVAETGISLVCVGTPSRPNGSLDLSYVERVSEEIGAGLASRSDYHVVVARSTMLPGSTDEAVVRRLESASGKSCGEDFGVCFNPEFLREGTSIRDFYDPPFTVIGADDERAASAVKSLYAAIDAPLHVVPVREAEMLKYACNAFHGLKVAFANEIGNLCKQQEIDSHKVMELFCRDDKLNLSSYYLKPGFAFGGSCLPKDLRALLHHARSQDTSVPVLESILPSNERQIDVAYQMVASSGARRVGVLGFSFKAGTDDLRESPMVALIERLIGKGYQLKVYDRSVSLANLHGANRAYIEQEIPHIASLITESLDDLLQGSDVIVVGNRDPEFAGAIGALRDDQVAIDLVRILDGDDPQPENVRGICW